MKTSPSTEKTLFRQQAERYQEEQKRTKSTGIRNGLYVAGSSAAGLAVSLILVYLFPEEIPATVKLMIPICAVGILYGFYRIVFSAIKSTKQVTCPKCSKVHEIFKKERLSMCTDCGTLLGMGKDVESPIEFVTCQYCENQAAVSHDHGTFLCYNCGITRPPTTIAVEWETTKCSSCEEIVPLEALYCKHCGQILKPLPSYDMNWRIGKDAQGHFHFARMLLATFPAKEALLAAKLSSDDLQSEQRKWGAALNEMRVLLKSLGEVQRSLEEALQVPELRAPVERLLPEIDFLYARLLVLELKTFVWAEGPENQTLRVKDYGGLYFNTFDTGNQIHTRKRLEQILGLESLQSAGSIGPWDDGGLVSAISERGEAEIIDPTKPSITTLLGYAGLQVEAMRFAEWAKQSGRSADLLDTVSDLQEKISARKTKELPIKAPPPTAEKKEPEEIRGVATGAAATASSKPISRKKPRSTGKSAISKRQWGCFFASCGSFIVAIALIIIAAVVATIFDPDATTDPPGVVLSRTAICFLPAILIGSVLLKLGISRLRSQRKQAVAEQTDSGSEVIVPGDSKELFRDGLSLFNQEKFREAIPILENAVRIDPTFAPAQFTLGGAFSKVAGEYADDEDAIRIWANKSADAFRKSISLASLYGGLNEKQLTLAQKAVMTYERAETAYKIQREASLPPEGQRKQIYAEFMETKNAELLQGIDIHYLTEASKRGELAQIAQDLERDATEAEKKAIAKITKKYRITKEQLMAIAQEGEEQKWPFGEQ